MSANEMVESRPTSEQIQTLIEVIEDRIEDYWNLNTSRHTKAAEELTYSLGWLEDEYNMALEAERKGDNE